MKTNIVTLFAASGWLISTTYFDDGDYSRDDKISIFDYRIRKESHTAKYIETVSASMLRSLSYLRRDGDLEDNVVVRVQKQSEEKKKTKKKKAKKNTSIDDECVVCFQKLSTHANHFQCIHDDVCTTCSPRLQLCPLCRAPKKHVA